MAELLALGITDEPSDAFTLSVDDRTTINLKSATPPAIDACSVKIQYQDGADWFDFGELTDKNPIFVLNAPGVFRVRRNPCAYPVGVSRTTT
jgi:hypothetical protein